MDISMEEQMKYILMPSLQQRALIKIVITVWNQDDVRAFTVEKMESMGCVIGREEMREKWQVVEDKVIEKVQVLPLPESLQIRLVGVVKPILLEVLHNRLPFYGIFETDKLNKICWTPQGTIDKKKTAEAIIRDEKLSIGERYQIACAYCLQNDILTLWNKIPEDKRKYYYREEYPPLYHLHLVTLWTYDVKGEINTLEYTTRKINECTPYQYALEGAVKDNNQVATEYILQKLTTEEREKSLVTSAQLCCKLNYFMGYPYCVDVLCFLLSQMNEEQQIEVLKVKCFKCSRAVLECFLCWPWQGLFMKMAKHVWAFLPTDGFYHLLQRIIEKVKDGFKDYDYQYLFREFWQQSPRTHKEHIIVTSRQFESCPFSLFDLVQIKDKGNIKLILEDLTTPDRENVILSTLKKICFWDKIDLLEFFVQECLPTKDITIKIREFVKQKCT